MKVNTKVPEIPIRRTWQDIRDKLNDTGEVTVVFGTELFYSGMKRNGRRKR